MLGFLHRYELKMEFSKEGYDLSLNFVKGICILLVLIHHTTGLTFHQESWFFAWGYPAVPLFLLIQVFHSYKNGFDGNRVRWGRIWMRAFFPFFFAEILIQAARVVMFPLRPIRFLLEFSLYWGGSGPGSYYPWIYIQFAILLPLLKPLFRHLNGKWLIVIFLLLSIGGEVLCNYLQVPEWIYRLLFVRYIFLIYLGYELVIRGVVLNILTLCLSVISLVALYFFEIKDFRFPPFFYYAEGWKSFHWICYFYIAYPMLYLLCRLFYRLPANGKLENIVCEIGHHSYAIYIFQLFYFSVMAPYVKELLSTLGQPTLSVALYLLISIVVCIFPVLRFVRESSNMAIFRKVIVGALLISSVVMLVGWKWRPFYTPPTPIKPFPVIQHDDDTLRVIMIGDSWVYFHQTLRRDSTFENELKRVLKSRKVKVVAKGKYGATSGEIYQRMSAERTMAMDYDLNYCAQSIIEAGADYCVISAGINDARQRRGRDYYVINYFRMIRLLLTLGIRPVVMEIPTVDVEEAYSGNTLYYKIKARLTMSMLKTPLHGVDGYRLPLRDSLISNNMMDSIIYVRADSWNPDGWKDKRDIYTDDHFHLNLPGFAILDSTFAAEIVKDYRQRKKK